MEVTGRRPGGFKGPVTAAVEKIYWHRLDISSIIIRRKKSKLEGRGSGGGH